MKVAFDNTFFTLLLNPKARARPNPATNEPATHCGKRIEGLIEKLSKQSATILIPAPSLAELLCVVNELDTVIGNIEEYKCFEICPFDTRSAVELAKMTRSALDKGDKREGTQGDWQKIKIDRQIVAIAKAHGASTLFTDDDRQSKFAENSGLKVVHTWDLDLPEKYAQTTMWDFPSE